LTGHGGVPQAHGPATFVVRVSGSDSGPLRGTVQRVRTGETHGFRSVEELAAIVAQLATDGASAPPGSGARGRRS
jgi:hypothetical protein